MPRTAAPVLDLRAAVSLVLAAAGCALAAVILGEYDFSGAMPYGAGVLLGLVVAEFVVSVGRLRSWLVALVTAVLVAAALGWAAWISSGEGLRPYPMGAWVAIVTGAVSSGARTFERRPRAVTGAAGG